MSTKKIKIVHVLEACLGGIGKHVIDLINGIDKDKYDIVLVYSKRRIDEKFQNEILSIKFKGVNSYEISMSRSISILKDFMSLVSLIRILKFEKPNILHLHGAKAGALGRLASLLLKDSHVIYNPHGGSFHKFSGIKGMLYLFVERFLSNCTASYIGVSKYACNEIKKNIKLQENRIHLIYNGIDPDGLLRTPADTTSKDYKSKEYKNKFIVLYPAMFFEAKGHIELLYAIKHSRETLNENIVLLLAGDGPLRSIIESKIKMLDLGKQVGMLGFIKEIYSIMYISDLVILPSRSEAFGYVILEAMACSKTVLATSVGSIPEIIKDGYNGVLLAGKDINNIVQHLNYLSNSKEELKRMGSNGSKYIREKFTLANMIEETQRLYEKLSKSPQNTGINLIEVVSKIPPHKN